MICDKCKSTVDIRSIRQNRYFYKVVSIIAEHLGYTVEEMKCLLKIEFGMYDEGINKKTGETFYIYHSTADLTKKQFSDLTEKILIFGNKLGINILTPEEYWQT